MDERRPLSARLAETFYWFGYLGLTAFGGPAAHISIFHGLFVDRLKWLDERMFAEVFAIGQALPGPGSTQMLFIIALHLNGLLCGILAFILWSLPGFVIMTSLACFVINVPPTLPHWAIELRHGLSAVAVGLVAAAGYRLSLNLIKNNFDIVLCWLAACAGILGHRATWVPPTVIFIGGILKLIHAKMFQSTRVNGPEAESLLPNHGNDAEQVDTTLTQETPHTDSILTSRKTSIVSLSIFFIGLILSFVMININTDSSLELCLKVLASFYITGAIIFGGGPVVIPMLYNYVVLPGWVSANDFLFGLTIINILPGPNFNFGAYCAALSLHHLFSPNATDARGIMFCILGAFIGYFGIFFPGLSVKVGIIPAWKHLRELPNVKEVLHGISSAAVGLVFTALVTLFLDAFLSLQDTPPLLFICIAISSFVATAYLRIHPLLLIVLGGGLSLLSLINY